MWLLEHYNNGLGRLADDMGLGKTLQTLSTLVAVQEKLDFEKPKISNSICLERNSCCQRIPKSLDTPSSLVFNWYNEENLHSFEDSIWGRS
jgi:non-specific serine/threonine protein kinase